MRAERSIAHRLCIHLPIFRVGSANSPKFPRKLVELGSFRLFYDTAPQLLSRRWCDLSSWFITFAISTILDRMAEQNAKERVHV